MQDLRLIGVHEDGEHLLLSDADGGRFRVRVDEPLRAAIRHDRPRLGQQQVEADAALRPRDVQALIRAGSSAEEVAERSGWSVEKVRRYEGPIVAEREHVAGLSRGVRVRGRSSGAGAPTLSVRVGERLKGRGVDPAAASWDAWREEGGPWTVVVTFAAGGRQRQASWHFDLADRTVTAIDDEARWLSEEEEPAPGPIPAPHLSVGPSRSTTVYDVEAEGGVRATQRSAPAEPERLEVPPRVDIPAARGPEPLDLMTAMRERTTARRRRRGGSRRGPRKAPTNLPGAGDQVPDDAMPLEDLAYDPGTMPPPPGAHAHPEATDPLDARPEPEAAAWAEAAGAALDQSDPAPAVQAPEPDDEATAADTVGTTPADAETAEVLEDAETAEVLESVQSLEAPHRAPQPDEEPATKSAAASVQPLQPVESVDEASVEPRPVTPVEPEPEPEPEVERESPRVADVRPEPEVEAAPEPAAEKAPEPIPEVEPEPEPEAETGPEPEDEAVPEPKAEAKPKPAAPARRNGRPSVPSWDDIMFGARPGGRS